MSKVAASLLVMGFIVQSASESESITHRIGDQQRVLKAEAPKIDDLSVNGLN